MFMPLILFVFRLGCPECKSKFSSFDSFLDHIQKTGHVTDKPASFIRTFSDSSECLTMSSIRSGMTSDASVNSPLLHATLYFGVYMPKLSLVGACGWVLRDDKDTLFSQGAVHITQQYNSLSTLDYEGLLHALTAAYTQNIKHITIICKSSLIISDLIRNETSPYLSTIYLSLSVLKRQIKQCLCLFNKYEFIETKARKMNYQCISLAQKAILAYNNECYNKHLQATSTLTTTANTTVPTFTILQYNNHYRSSNIMPEGRKKW